MIRLLRFLAWRHSVRHGLRTFLTFLGIVLGVAVILSISMVNRTLMHSFNRTIDRIAGKAVLQVANAESGIPEDLLPSIRHTPGVRDAAPTLEGFLPVVGQEGERLYIYGVDFLTDFSMREYEFVGTPFDLDAALDFIARPDSIALTEDLSRRLGIPPGAKISLMTSRGVREYAVRALLRNKGPARVFGGSLALMDLPVAQIALGKEGKLDTVDLTLEEGESIGEVRQRIQERLGGAARVERPDERGKQVESLLRSFRIGLFFVSLIALFVGFFLIYNTVAVSIVQRRREIGTLRCLGILKRSVLILFVAETLLLALVGSLVGALVGVVLAQAALYSVGETVTNIFLPLDLAGSAPTLGEIAIATGGGLGVAVLAAFFPSWQATQVSPLEASRQSSWGVRVRKNSRAVFFGLFLLLLWPFLLVISPAEWDSVARFSLGVAAMLVFLVGLSLISPVLVLGWVRCFWKTLGRSWHEGRLAADSLRRNPTRSGITIATLMISLAAIFTIATFVHSVRGSLILWVDQMVTADLVVHSSAKTAGGKNVPLREDLGAAFRHIPGVRIVDLYRLLRSTYEGEPILVESFSVKVSAAERKLPMVAGDGRSAFEAMARGEGILVSESFQARFQKGLGDVVRLPTPSGFVHFPVAGVFVDYSSDSGSILMDRALYKKFWRDELVDAYDIWLAPEADPEPVIREIKGNYGEPYQLFVSTHGELRNAVVEIMEQSFSVNYAVEFIAVVVAIFSVVNTLLASVLDRTGEIGVLRALGATRAQAQRMVMLEAGWMGFLGGIFGLLAGSVMAYHHVVYNTKVLTGWTFQFHYPFGFAALCLFFAVMLCLAAGYLPARQVGSGEIASAIGYE